MEILKLLVRVMIFLLSIIIIQSCGSNGWIIASIPLTPQDTVTNTVFIEIMDADSTIHWVWCTAIIVIGYRHQRLEEVLFCNDNTALIEAMVN